jgi:hypothetical protein
MTSPIHDAPGVHDPVLDPLVGSCRTCQGPISRASERDAWRHDVDNTEEFEAELLMPETPNRDPNIG